MKEDVSIIMLTYNRKNLIPRAIDSILAQTMKSYKFIIIDNGSTDESGSIAEDYAKKDERIKVIHIDKANIGTGRNIGLNHANGKYITFIDDDDTADSDMISFLFDQAESEQADISLCGSNKVIDNVVYPNCVFKERIVMSPEEAVITLLKRKKFNAAMPSKMFRRELFDKIRFKTVGKYDDISVVYKYFAEAKKVVAFGKPKYSFWRHESNNSAFTTNDSLLSPEQLEEYFEAFRERTLYLSKRLPNIADYAQYSEWSYMISMYNKITINKLESCKKQREFIEKELINCYNAFGNSPYLQEFEKEYLQKYIFPKKKFEVQ